MAEALSIIEHSTLAECESEMEQCRDNFRRDFRRFGALLDRVLTEELYLERDPTLTKDGYCRQQWGFTLQRAHQIIQASKASPVEIASTVVDAISTVQNEWQARQSLQKAKSIDEVKSVRDAAERWRNYFANVVAYCCIHSCGSACSCLCIWV